MPGKLINEVVLMRLRGWGSEIFLKKLSGGGLIRRVNKNYLTRNLFSDSLPVSKNKVLYTI